MVPELPTGEKRKAYWVVMGTTEKGDHFDDLGIGGWTVLKWVLNMTEGVERFYPA